MQKVLAAVIVLGAMTLALVAWLRRDDAGTESGSPGVATPQEVAAPPVAAAPPAARPARTGERSPSSAKPGDIPLGMVGKQHAFDASDPNNAATSSADADWLHRAGFLDPRSERLMRDASLEDLEAAAKTDLRAQVILAYRLAAAGTYGNRPMELLEDAAVRGSVFALMTWGDIHYTLDGYRNPALGNAYYRLAYRRGYFTAATANYTLSPTLNAEMRLLSDVFSESAWSRLQALRTQRGMTPFRDTELRPGFNAFLAQIEQGLRQQQQDQPERPTPGNP